MISRQEGEEGIEEGVITTGPPQEEEDEESPFLADDQGECLGLQSILS